MGAIFNYDYFPAAREGGLNPVAAKKMVEKMISDYIMENGFAGYTGSWSEVTDVKCLPQKVFDNQAQAQDWLEDHAEKWGPALLVPVHGGGWAVGAWCSS